MELSACANFTKITLGQQTKFWTLRQSWNQKSFFNWDQICVVCSDRGIFANPYLENFNSWCDPLHMIGALRGIRLPNIPYL